MRWLKTYQLFESVDEFHSDFSEVNSKLNDMLLELGFQSIVFKVVVYRDLSGVYIELRKRVKDRSAAVLYGDVDDSRSFNFDDVSGVINMISDYLSDWGLKPTFLDDPGVVVRADWGGDGNTDLLGYDSVMYLNWRSGKFRYVN